MAFTFTSTSSQCLTSLTSPVTGYPFSISLWIKRTSSTASGVFLSLNSSNLSRISISQLGSAEIVVETAALTGNNTIQLPSIDVTSLPLSTWEHVIGVAQTSANIKLYYNGGALSAEYVGGSTPVGINQVIIGARRTNTGTLSQLINASIAEAAVWSTEISAEEALSLYQGFSPLKIRPDQLRYYAPLIRDRTELVGGLTLVPSNIPPGVEAHPRKIDN